MVMDAVLIATGFTGALTLVWLIRLVGQLFRQAVSVAVAFAPAGGCTDVLVREIGAARREVLVLAGQLANRPLAQALVDARLRGATVEVVLAPMNATNPGSDLAFLTEQGLAPLLGKPGLLHHFVLIDERTLLSASFPFVSRADTDLTGNLLVVRGHAELVRSCREEFVKHREQIREAAPLPAPAATAPMTPAPTPPTPPAPAAPRAVTVPTAVEKPSLPRPVEEAKPMAPVVPRPAVAAAAVSPIASAIDDRDGPDAEHRSEAPAPMITPASADLFARLRKQLAEMPERSDSEEKAA